MKHKFVDLFDPEEHGWNFSAALWLLAGFFVNTCISMSRMIYYLATFAGVDSLESFFEFLSSWAQGGLAKEIAPPLGEFLLVWGWGFTDDLVLALALIGLAHVLKKDFLLPLCVGAVTLNWAALESLLSFDGLDWPLILEISAWAFLLSGSLVACYRVVDNKLVSIVLAFTMAAILDNGVICLVYGVPLGDQLFNFEAVVEVLRSSLVGLIFYRGIARTIQRGK